jgi:hypothetical protein
LRRVDTTDWVPCQDKTVYMPDSFVASREIQRQMRADDL